MIRHLKRWNKWRRYDHQHNAWQKLLVLFGIRESVTFALTMTDEEIELYGSDKYKKLCDAVNEVAYAADIARHKFEEVEQALANFQEVIRNDGLDDLKN